jgi:hypothetical protein
VETTLFSGFFVFMQFNDTSNDTGIVQDIYWLTGTNTTSYPLKDIARNVNRWYYKAIVAQMHSNREWQVDDSNFTTYPIATTTLVAAQKDYVLPTDLLKLQRVFVKDVNGEYQPLHPIDAQKRAQDITEEFKTDGIPLYYDVLGDSIFLYPAPAAGSVTLSAGLKLLYSRDFDAFTAADTTQEPGFPEPYHRILSFGGSYDWFLARGDSRASAMRAEAETLLRELQSFNHDRDMGTIGYIRNAHRTSTVQ